MTKIKEALFLKEYYGTQNYRIFLRLNLRRRW
jgi:hypothetical protein